MAEETETNAHEQILAKLDSLSERLAAVEARVGVAAGGTDPLQAKLAEPEVAAGLARILDRMETLESTARTLESLRKRAPILVDGGADTLDYVMNELESRGVDPFVRGEQGLAVLEKASRPEHLELVSELLDHAGTVRFAAQAGGKAVGAMEDPDGVADGLARLAGKGGAVLTSPVVDKLVDSALLDPETLERSVEALDKLARVASTPAFQELLDSGLLDPQVLGTAGSATTALVETKKAGTSPVGLFGTLGKLGDPDVKKAMGFLFAVLKRFGQRL